jgi:serine/threonine protein kinase
LFDLKFQYKNFAVFKKTLPSSSFSEILFIKLLSCKVDQYGDLFFSSAEDSETGDKVAIKKLSRPFIDPTIARRTYREIKVLKFMRHENVRRLLLFTLIMSVIEDCHSYFCHPFFVFMSVHVFFLMMGLSLDFHFLINNSYNTLSV